MLVHHRGRRDFGNVKMTSKEKAKKLYEIVDVLKEFKEYTKGRTDQATRNTPKARQLVRKAMTLLADNLKLLNECKNKYGCHSPLQECFECIEQAASFLRTKDLGDYSYWVCNFCKPRLWDGVKRSFADECMRYANEVDREINEQKVIISLGEYESEHGNKIGISPADLEREVEMTWPQLRPVLDRLGRKGLIEGHKGDGYTSYWLSVEFDENDPYKHQCSVKEFRLTQQGQKLYGKIAEKPAGAGQGNKGQVKTDESTQNRVTTQDIEELLKLFRQLENLLNPELPPRDGQLWFKAMEQSRKELADKLKKRQSGFTLRPSWNNLKRESTKARHPKKEEQAERIILQMAEKKYRLWDSKYDQSLSQVEEKIVQVVKRIDHTLYSIKEPLLAFDRTQGTLLQANFRNIRDDFTVNEIRQFQDMVKKSIDALEAIRLKVERQQHLETPIKNQVSPNKKNAKTTFAALFISFMMILLFELLVHVGPLSWFKNHPNSYSLQGSIICLIPCLLLGLFKPQWRKWCWGVAGLAFLGIVLSLLGGRSRQ